MKAKEHPQIDLDIARPADDVQETFDSVLWPGQEAVFNKGSYWTSNNDLDTPEVEKNAQANFVRAKGSLAAAEAAGEAYELRSASFENYATMLRSVDFDGPSIAKEFDIDPTRLMTSRVQLLNALENRQHGMVDASTYMITALSLARRAAEQPNESAEQRASTEALEVLKHKPEDVTRFLQEQALGPHTGEIAVAAIMGYDPSQSK